MQRCDESTSADPGQSGSAVTDCRVIHADTPLETEVKFVVPSGQILDRVQAAGHIAGHTCGSLRVTPQRDLYFDTNSYALLSRGMSLRYRHVGDAHLVTFKRPSTICHTRVEIEDEIGVRGACALTDGLLEDLDVPASRAAMEWVGSEPILPVLLVANHRSSSLIESTAGRIKACFDRVEYSPRVLGYDGTTVEYELELELQDGDEQFLELLAHAVTQEYGLTMHSQSKYERGMDALGVLGAEKELFPHAPYVPSIANSA